MARTVKNSAMLADIAKRQAAGESFCLATVVRAQAATAAKAGYKAIVTEDGRIEGFIGGGCVQNAVRRVARQALSDQRARLIRVKPGDEVKTPTDGDGVELHKSTCPSRGTVDFFIEPMTPPPLLLVVGASPVAEALATQAAAMGYRVLAAAEANDAEKFKPPMRFQAGFDFSAENIAPHDYVVVSTQGRRDLDALCAALNTPAHYVAIVSSRAKTSNLCGKLQNKGMPADLIARLKAPAGLDIQAIEPDEIALSILAEIIQRRRRDSRLAANNSMR